MLAVSNGKHNVSVWRPSVHPTICPIFLLTLTEHVEHTQSDSPGGSTWRCQHTFRQTIRRTDILVLFCTGSVPMCH